MPLLHIHLLGKFTVTTDGSPVSGLEATKAQEIFAYLLVHRARAHARELLVDQLWGDSTKIQAQKGLRQALWQLQSALNEPDRSAPHPLLLVDPLWIQLNPTAPFWLDIAVLEESYALTKGHPGTQLAASQAQRLAAAVDLYRGDLLEGCYHDWCLIERERLQHMLLALLDKLFDYEDVQDNFEAALAYGERILRFDRAREQTHYKLMQVYIRAGDRTGALRQFESCVDALKTELAVPPAKRTVALYQAIKADQVDIQAPVIAPPLLQSTSPSLPTLYQHLQQMQATLSLLQTNVARDIALIERIIGDVPN